MTINIDPQFFQTYTETKKWLHRMGVTNFSIDENNLNVFCQGNLYLPNKSLTLIPVQFSDVTGDVSISGNPLTSLKGMPRVVGGVLFCHQTEITSFEFGPCVVRGYWASGHNKINSLEHLPQKVNGRFNFLQEKSIKSPDSQQLLYIGNTLINMPLDEFKKQLSSIKLNHSLHDILKEKNSTTRVKI